MFARVADKLQPKFITMCLIMSINAINNYMFSPSNMAHLIISVNAINNYMFSQVIWPI